MIGALKRWVNRRRRAVCLGDMKPPKVWYDPQSKSMWMAQHRWSIAPVSLPDSDPVDSCTMLEMVSRCNAYVSPEEARDRWGDDA